MNPTLEPIEAKYLFSFFGCQTMHKSKTNYRKNKQNQKK
jgi:hypothetical protein